MLQNLPGSRNYVNRWSSNPTRLSSATAGEMNFPFVLSKLMHREFPPKIAAMALDFVVGLMVVIVHSQ